MMEWIIFIPTLAACALLLFRRTHYVFFTVYLFSLLCLPSSFRCQSSWLPNLSFSEAALLPVAIAFCLTDLRKWKFSLLDVFVVMTVLWNVISEYAMSEYNYLRIPASKLAFNIGWQSMLSILFPYMLGKYYIEQKRLTPLFAKRFVILIFFGYLLMMTELFFGFNFWHRLLSGRFPGQGHGWLLYRWNLPRIYGPFEHTIFACLMFVIAYRLSRWLEWNNQWEKQFKYIPTPCTKATCLRILLFIGAFLASSRGVWLAALAGLVIIGVAKARHKIPVFLMRSVIWITIFSVSYKILTMYAELHPDSTINYRIRLVDTYWIKAWQSPWLGWGRIGWSINNTQPSIDNFYLYEFLTRGIPGVALFGVIFSLIIFRMIRRAIYTPTTTPRLNDIAFTIAAILITFVFSLSTVWMSNQVSQVLFLFIGWAEGYLTYTKQNQIVPELAVHSSDRWPPSLLATPQPSALNTPIQNPSKSLGC